MKFCFRFLLRMSSLMLMSYHGKSFQFWSVVSVNLAFQGESVIDIDPLPDEFSNPGVFLLQKADHTLGSRVFTSLLRVCSWWHWIKLQSAVFERSVLEYTPKCFIVLSVQLIPVFVASGWHHPDRSFHL